MIFPIGGIMHQTGRASDLDKRTAASARSMRYLSARWQDRMGIALDRRRFILNRRRPGCRWNGNI